MSKSKGRNQRGLYQGLCVISGSCYGLKVSGCIYGCSSCWPLLLMYTSFLAEPCLEHICACVGSFATRYQL